MPLALYCTKYICSWVIQIKQNMNFSLSTAYHVRTFVFRKSGPLKSCPFFEDLSSYKISRSRADCAGFSSTSEVWTSVISRGWRYRNKKTLLRWHDPRTQFNIYLKLPNGSKVTSWRHTDRQTERYFTRHTFLLRTVGQKVPTSVAARSTAAWLLGSRVRIPLRAWMFVSRVSMLCCPVQVEASATGWSLVQRSPTVCPNTIM
jgi:hypothetical protein